MRHSIAVTPVYVDERSGWVCVPERQVAERDYRHAAQISDLT